MPKIGNQVPLAELAFQPNQGGPGGAMHPRNGSRPAPGKSLTRSVVKPAQRPDSVYLFPRIARTMTFFKLPPAMAMPRSSIAIPP